MSTRQIEEVRFGVYSNRLQTLRFKVTGGDTGDHMVTWISGEWHCDCIGFMSNKKCRHVKMGEIMLRAVFEALQQIENGELKNWK